MKIQFLNGEVVYFSDEQINELSAELAAKALTSLNEGYLRVYLEKSGLVYLEPNEKSEYKKAFIISQYAYKQPVFDKTVIGYVKTQQNWDIETIEQRIKKALKQAALIEWKKDIFSLFTIF